jgi:toxin HigB-1
MIGSIRDRNTLKVWNTEPCRKLPEDIQEPAREKMLIIHAMTRCPEDLWAIPSLKAEKLSGGRKGQWSIRINKQWRICFFWNQETQIATQVEITDYH